MEGCGCLVNCASLVTRPIIVMICAILNQALTFKKIRPGDEASTMCYVIHTQTVQMYWCAYWIP